MLSIRAIPCRLAEAAGRFRREESGVAAIEFAMIVPIMIMLFFGSVEFSQALTVDRRVTQVASSTADLIAQTDKITNSQITDLMNIVTTLLRPYPTAPLNVQIKSIKRVDQNPPVTVWSCTHANGSTSCSAAGSTPASMPAGLIDNPTSGGTSSVIYAEVSYTFTPTIGQFLTSGVSLNEKFYLKPRKSLCVWNQDVTTAMCG
jgi:Flp pilus assembly protein TadG